MILGFVVVLLCLTVMIKFTPHYSIRWKDTRRGTAIVFVSLPVCAILILALTMIADKNFMWTSYLVGIAGGALTELLFIFALLRHHDPTPSSDH